MLNKVLIFFGVAILFSYGTFAFYSYFHKTEPSLSILIGEHANPNTKDTPLLKGNVFNYSITATEDNFGIVAIRFQTFGKISSDTLAFRIKPQNSPSWTYQANYKTDQFQNEQLFPFGFVPFKDSKGKIYQIQIESLQGTENDHVSISRIYPSIVSKYQYSPENGTTTMGSKFKFGTVKISNISTNLSTAFPLFLYFCPLIVYFINLISLKRNKRPLYLSIFIPQAFMGFRTYFDLPTPYYWKATLFLTWLTYVLATKISYRLSVVISLSFGLFLILRSYTANAVLMNQAAFGLYLSLVIVFIQIFSNSFFKPKS